MTDYGLEVVNMPDLRPYIEQLSIVCVHGYGADADTTWTHPVTGKKWINDPEFVNRLPKPARVLSFTYNSDIASNLSAASVAFNADDLLSCVEQALSTDGPVYFVAHGFGGIIVKKALQLLNVVSRYPRVKRFVSGVIFFGTPYTDTNSDALFQAVKRSVAALHPGPHTELEEDVRQYAAVVGHINRKFINSKPKSLYMLSFWEKAVPRTFTNAEVPLPIMTREGVVHDFVNRNFDMACTYADLPRFPSVFDKRFILFVSEFSHMIALSSKDRDSQPSYVRPPPPPAILPPPPQPPPPVVEDGIKSAVSDAPSPQPRPGRSKSSELYRFYLQKTGNEDLRAARTSFLQSLEGWSESNEGCHIKVTKGTCNWIDEEEPYKTWLSYDGSINICYLGEPGQGKTYLARAVADNLRKARSGDIVLSFFCDSEQGNPPIWDYLTWHLLQERLEWFHAVPSRYHSRNKKSPQLSQANAVEIWSTMLSHISCDAVYLIVDGLDQHGEECLQKFIDTVMQLRHPAPASRKGPASLTPTAALKVFLTCRNLQSNPSSGDSFLRVQIPAPATHRDIRVHVTKKWDICNPKENTLHRDAVIDDIEHSAGIYWHMAEYAVQDVRFRMPSSPDGQMTSFRDRIPDGLEQFYLDSVLPIIQSVENNSAVRTFLILLASHTFGEPLRVAHWNDALKCLGETNDISTKAAQTGMAELIRQHLGHLMSVTKKGDICYHHDSFLMFLRRFLSPVQRCTNMAYLCLKYLLQDQFRTISPHSATSPSSDTKAAVEADASFYSYASKYWLNYVKDLEMFEPGLEGLLLDFLSKDCPQFTTWRASYGGLSADELRRRSKDLPLTELLYKGAAGFFQYFFPAPKEVCAKTNLPLNIKHMLQALKWPRLEKPNLYAPGWPNIIDCHGRTPLMAAVVSGNVELVRHLLKWPLDMKAQDFNTDSILFLALSGSRPPGPEGDVLVKCMLDELLRCGADPNQCAQSGQTPLQFACAQNNVPAVVTLLDAGARINAGDIHGSVPLGIAVHSGSEELLRVLVQRGAEVDIWLEQDEIPLTLCIHNNDLSKFKILLDIANINLAIGTYTPLQAAVLDADNVEFLRLLLARPDLDLDAGSPPALELAISQNNYEGVEMLLQAGASTGILTSSGRPLLTSAVLKGSMPLVELLLNYQAPVNLIHHSRSRKTALARAVSMDRADLVASLLARGADPSIEDGLGVKGPLHIAFSTYRSNMEIIKLLLKAAVPPDVNFAPPGKRHVLLLAIEDGNIESVKLLLQHGLDLSLWLESGAGGCAPLNRAAESGNVDICELLLKAEPRLLNFQRKDSNSYESPLHSACSRGQAKVVKFLLNQGAKADQLSYYYNSSPLLLACESGDLECVEMVLEAAPQMVNVKSYCKETPLMYACVVRNLQMIRLLLRHGADMHARDSYGDSCVFFAFNEGRKVPSPQVLEVLLEHGLDINAIVSSEGFTILAATISSGNVRDVRWLLEKGADPLRCGMEPYCSGPWWNALQHALVVGKEKMAKLLLEPQWGLWEHITDQDWYGASALPRFGLGNEQRVAVRLLFEKSEEEKAVTGKDAFAEVMHQKLINGYSTLDLALGCHGVLPAARPQWKHLVGSVLEKLVSITRTPEEHSCVLIEMGQLLAILPEYREDGRTLLAAVLSQPNIAWEDDEVKEIVGCFWACQVCDDEVHEVVYLCVRCLTAHCGQCRDKGGWRIRHNHEWLDIALIDHADLNAPSIQHLLERLAQELLRPPSNEEDQPAPAPTPEEDSEALLQSGLQLAVLHAFNRLAVRRPAWTPYLPLSSAAEALVAPFADLTRERRRHLERRNLADELSPCRLAEEQRYFARGLVRPYLDEELVRLDMVVQRVHELFPVDSVEDE